MKFQVIGFYKKSAEKLINKLISRKFSSVNSKVEYLLGARLSPLSFATRLGTATNGLEYTTLGVNTDLPVHHFYIPRYIYNLSDVYLDSSTGDVYSPEKRFIYES